MSGGPKPADEDYAAGDFLARYDDSIQAALAAFGAEGALERTVALPFGEFSGAAFMSLAATDQFTHGWDLARALGHPTDLDPELAGELLTRARTDAEDLVQETYLRAWRSYSGFKGQSSERTWLYRIATNACLTALEHRSRRVLPSGLGGAEPDPEAAPVPAGPGVAWLQPIPDAMVSPDSADPAAIVTAREGLRLALIASLQYLPGPQRAVLILRDVLAFPAAEVAAMLGTTTTAVKSTLQRARARLRELAPAADDVTEPAEPEARALLDRYIAAFQNADAAALRRLLCADATLEATPFRTWFAGCDTCVPFLRAWVLGAPGDWRMLPARANGQPAAVCYCRDRDGAYQAYGVVTFTMTATEITRVISFGDPALVRAFGFPPVLPPPASSAR